MRNLSRASIFIGLSLLLSACGRASPIAPTPIVSQSATSTPILIIPTSTLVSPGTIPTVPFPNPSATIGPALRPALPNTSLTPTQSYPTLMPTTDPEMVGGLLREALSIQTVEGVNEHSIQRITGWSYGFRQRPCCGYQWLDSKHLLLYPRTGEGMLPYMDGSIRGDLSSRPVIINLENGHMWLPGLNPSPSIYFSSELGIVFLQEIYGTSTGPAKEAVFTYTLDGKEIARYWGKILGVSPKGTKVLVDEDTIIDLRTGEIIDLAWHMDYDLELSSKLYWSSDETRLYRCCFYYADLKTGKSYNFEWSDLRGVDAKAPPPLHSPHPDGRWVRNDTYIFPKWDYWTYAGDPPMMFSPAEKKYYPIKISSSLPINSETLTYTISPDGIYVWIKGLAIASDMYHGFLVNLTTLETTSYDNTAVNDFFWSPNSKFGWMDGIDSGTSYVLSVSTKKVLPFPVNPRYDDAKWQPQGNVLAYMAENDQTLALLNAKDMTVEGRKLPFSIIGFDWSPNGDRIRFIAKDHSLWQVDYPRFQNFEQLTRSMPDINEIFWSPDGQYLAFISGSDIYVVETTNK